MTQVEIVFCEDDTTIESIVLPQALQQVVPRLTCVLDDFFSEKNMCESNNFSAFADNIFEKCIEPFEMEIEEEDKKCQSSKFIRFFENILQNLEDKLLDKDYNAYYNLLVRLAENAEAEQRRICEATPGKLNFKCKTALLGIMKELVNALTKTKDNKGIFCYCISYV